MNMHNKAFLASAIALGLVAGALASSHVAPSNKPAAEIQLPSIEIVGHRMQNPEVALQPIVIVGDRAALLAAADAKEAAQG